MRLKTYITTSNLAQFQNDCGRMVIPYIRRIRIERGCFFTNARDVHGFYWFTCDEVFFCH